MADPLERLREAAALRAFNGANRELEARPLSGPSGSDAFAGLVDFASDDYLGLSRDPRVAASAATAALSWGAGGTGSRVVSGTTQLHVDLETALARYLDAPSALVFSTGYMANLAVLSVLGGEDVLVVTDAADHVSLVDGAWLGGGRHVVVPHRDVAAVERLLADRSQAHAIVATEAVFNVGGDLAPLQALHEATRRHGAMLVVDETHSVGVVGKGGRGAVHQAGLAGEPDVVRTVSLATALGAQGGAVVGAREVTSTLVDVARPFLCETALAPPATAGALAALGVLANNPDLPLQVRARANELAWLAQNAGLTVSRPDAAIVAVRCGDPHAAVRAAQTCAEYGVRVASTRPPAVPPDQSCLRLTVRANTTEDELRAAARALTAAARATEARRLLP